MIARIITSAKDWKKNVQKSVMEALSFFQFTLLTYSQPYPTIVLASLLIDHKKLKMIT